VVFSVVAHEVSKGVRNSALGPVDRSLGLLFGVVRGALLVCLAWMVAVWLMPNPEKDQPVWLREAKSRPLAETGAAWLQSLVPAQVRDQAAAQAGALQDKARQTLQDEAMRRMATAKPAPAAPPAPGSPAPAEGVPTYKKKDQDALGALIKNNAN